MIADKDRDIKVEEPIKNIHLKAHLMTKRLRKGYIKTQKRT